MKEWWNNFKEDLWFNITMTAGVSILMTLAILLSILCFKELITQIF